MIKQCHTIAPAEPEASRRRRYALSDRARVVEYPPDNLSCDLSHALWLDVIVEQVGDYPAGDGRWQAMKQEPLSARHVAAMQAYVNPTSLATRRKRELMHVGTQIANAV